jgi:hypothetical protein
MWATMRHASCVEPEPATPTLMRMVRTRLQSAIAVAMLVALSGAAAPGGPTYARVLPLGAEEGVFAYARISPDGRTLVYASETANPRGRGRMRTIRVVELAGGKVLFTEPGIDAYWSPDGRRMIYQSFADGGVSIRDHASGVVTRRVAPSQLGDYFSWGVRDGRDLVLTINSNFYFLRDGRAELPHGRIPRCERIGVGDRPLLSKDGRRVTTFVAGTIVVRGLTDCADVIDTGLEGQKADFSWDGRYIAFHALKRTGNGYEIRVVDLAKRTVRARPGLPGSALFPSWTRDGRLCFRYEAPDYRGFVIARGVLDAPAEPLPTSPTRLSGTRKWTDVFPHAPPPRTRLTAVLIWAPWSAHAPQALADFQTVHDASRRSSADVAFFTAVDPGSDARDVHRTLADPRTTLPALPLSASGLRHTEARNQMPTTLLFRGTQLVGRHLGALDAEQLKAWIAEAGAAQ